MCELVTVHKCLFLRHSCQTDEETPIVAHFGQRTVQAAL